MISYLVWDVTVHVQFAGRSSKKSFEQTLLACWDIQYALFILNINLQFAQKPILHVNSEEKKDIQNKNGKYETQKETYLGNTS